MSSLSPEYPLTLLPIFSLAALTDMAGLTVPEAVRLLAALRLRLLWRLLPWLEASLPARLAATNRSLNGESFRVPTSNLALIGDTMVLFENSGWRSLVSLRGVVVCLFCL